MNSNNTVTVVGSGITGLACAFLLAEQIDPKLVIILDAGPDPRLADLTHNFGASYSGSPTRQIGIGESGSWGNPEMAQQIDIPLSENGWNALSGTRLSDHEQLWRQKFIDSCEPGVLAMNVDAVHEINRQGVDMWMQLCKKHPSIFSVINNDWVIPYLCLTSEELNEVHAAELKMDPNNVGPVSLSIPRGLDPLIQKFDSAMFAGHFNTQGSGIYFKETCRKLIDHLEKVGVTFHWNTKVSTKSDIHEKVNVGSVVLTGGVQPGLCEFLADNELLLQGIGGYWIDIDNPGFDRPFHIEEYAPVNAISCTPYIRKDGTRGLAVAGADTWVGERPYDEAFELCQPLAVGMKKVVEKLFDVSHDGSTIRGGSVCIRPALPDGVPRFGHLVDLESGHSVHTIIGGVGGGATHAFAGAEVVVEEILGR